MVAYKCSATYAPATEGSVRFDDPDLAIDWGIDVRDAVLSDKDAAAPSFADFTSPFIHVDAT
jgi:dTDP-4-dehydrorhamnose 3,5-epimerase